MHTCRTGRLTQKGTNMSINPEQLGDYATEEDAAAVEQYCELHGINFADLDGVAFTDVLDAALGRIDLAAQELTR